MAVRVDGIHPKTTRHDEPYSGSAKACRTWGFKFLHSQRGNELKWWRCRDQRKDLWAVCLELPHRRSSKQTARLRCAYLRMVYLPDLLADVGLRISGEVEVPTDGHVRTARGIRRRAPTVVGPPIPEQRQTPDAESPISLCGVCDRGELKRDFDTILILYEAECGCPPPTRDSI
jgi:hypothetical protein